MRIRLLVLSLAVGGSAVHTDPDEVWPEELIAPRQPGERGR